GLPAEQRRTDGLPALPGEGLVDRFGSRRIGVQDGGRPAPEAGRDALARTRDGCPVPPARPLQERGLAMAGVLASKTAELNGCSTNLNHAHTHRVRSLHE